MLPLSTLLNLKTKGKSQVRVLVGTIYYIVTKCLRHKIYNKILEIKYKKYFIQMNLNFFIIY